MPTFEEYQRLFDPIYPELIGNLMAAGLTNEAQIPYYLSQSIEGGDPNEAMRMAEEYLKRVKSGTLKKAEANAKINQALAALPPEAAGYILNVPGILDSDAVSEAGLGSVAASGFGPKGGPAEYGPMSAEEKAKLGIAGQLAGVLGGTFASAPFTAVNVIDTVLSLLDPNRERGYIDPALQEQAIIDSYIAATGYDPRSFGTPKSPQELSPEEISALDPEAAGGRGGEGGMPEGFDPSSLGDPSEYGGHSDPGYAEGGAFVAKSPMRIRVGEGGEPEAVVVVPEKMLRGRDADPWRAEEVKAMLDALRFLLEPKTPKSRPAMGLSDGGG